MSIQAAVDIMGVGGYHGARGRPQGAVWRVETDGEFNFITKWVDPTKKDGFYLESEHPSGQNTWNLDRHSFSAG